MKDIKEFIREFFAETVGPLLGLLFVVVFMIVVFSLVSGNDMYQKHGLKGVLESIRGIPSDRSQPSPVRFSVCPVGLRPLPAVNFPVFPTIFSFLSF